jgi:hypothetical protein
MTHFSPDWFGIPGLGSCAVRMKNWKRPKSGESIRKFLLAIRHPFELPERIVQWLTPLVSDQPLISQNYARHGYRRPH